MKKRILILSLALSGMAAAAFGQVQLGVSVGAGDDSFHLAIGSYYHVAPEEVDVVEQRNIPDDEQPVVFFVAQRVHVAPEVIIDLRAQGISWVEIFHHYHISPRVLYIPAPGGWEGTPYAGYYAYYREGGRGPLADADIVNMVNLRFASRYYHRPPGEIIRMRRDGHDYHYIHDWYRPHPDRDRRGGPPDNGLHRGWDKDRKEHHFDRDDRGGRDRPGKGPGRDDEDHRRHERDHGPGDDDQH